MRHTYCLGGILWFWRFKRDGNADVGSQDRFKFGINRDLKATAKRRTYGYSETQRMTPGFDLRRNAESCVDCSCNIN